MFYLQTKDGERFLTDSRSSDIREFEKIIEDKLGRDAAELFGSLITEAKDDGNWELDSVASELYNISNDLSRALRRDELDREELDSILSDIQSLYHRI